MRLLLPAALIACVIAVVLVALYPTNHARRDRTGSALGNGLLMVAGLMSVATALIAFAAGAWGMDTRLPWGVGVYLYLLPALPLPSFLLL